MLSDLLSSFRSLVKHLPNNTFLCDSPIRGQTSIWWLCRKVLCRIPICRFPLAHSLLVSTIGLNVFHLTWSPIWTVYDKMTSDKVVQLSKRIALLSKFWRKRIVCFPLIPRRSGFVTGHNILWMQVTSWLHVHHDVHVYVDPQHCVCLNNGSDSHCNPWADTTGQRSSCPWVHIAQVDLFCWNRDCSCKRRGGVTLWRTR